MWNMNDLYVAGERYADLRRAAEQHNAIARMTAATQDKEQGKQQGAPQTIGYQSNKLLHKMRKVLR